MNLSWIAISGRQTWYILGAHMRACVCVSLCACVHTQREDITCHYHSGRKALAVKSCSVMQSLSVLAIKGLIAPSSQLVTRAWSLPSPGNAWTRTESICKLGLVTVLWSASLSNIYQMAGVGESLSRCDPALTLCRPERGRAICGGKAGRGSEGWVDCRTLFMLTHP